MNENSCCQPIKSKKPSGFLLGLLYGLLPHTFCIAFIVFSVLGATVATLIFRKLLLVPYFFHLLVLLSFIFATISAAIYLKRNNNLTWEGVKTNRTYLTILYGTTIDVNLLFFLVIFPLVTNFNSKTSQSTAMALQNYSTLTLKVAIPCSGHAPLITDELKKVPGVLEVKFGLPNYFTVNYNANQVKIENLLGLEIFKTYKAEFQP